VDVARKQGDAGSYSEEFGEKFQLHILAVAARRPEFVIRYRSALDHTYFSVDIHRYVAQSLFGFIDEHSTLPHRTTLLEEVRPQVPDDAIPAVEKALHALYKEDITDADAVEKKAVSFGKTQAMVNAVLESADELEKGNRQKVIPLIEDANMVGEDILDVGVDYQTTFEQRIQWYLDPTATVLDTVPTGIPHLDYAFNGGLPRGELGAILAPPGKGKTTALINFGFGALTAFPPDEFGRRGFNVVHFSCEMDEDRIARRYDDRLAGPHHIQFKKREPSKYIRYLELEARRRVLGRLFIKDYPTRTLTSSMIKSYLSLLASRDFVPDCIIVDYGDIMKAERRIGDMRHEQAGIYEDLRRIAGEYHAATWTASQAKVGALEKETPDIGDFSEAFEKAAIVGAAVAFCQTEEERLRNPQQCRLFVAKFRDEEDGRSVLCNIRRDCCWIKSVELVDPAGGRMYIPGEQPDDEDKRNTDTEMTETVVDGEPPKKTRKPSRKRTAETLKAVAGIKKKTTKKKFPKKSGKKTGKKTKRRSGSRKPSKTVR
jgi:hypothetical protein